MLPNWKTEEITATEPEIEADKTALSRKNARSIYLWPINGTRTEGKYYFKIKVQPAWIQLWCLERIQTKTFKYVPIIPAKMTMLVRNSLIQKKKGGKTLNDHRLKSLRTKAELPSKMDI